MTALLERVHKQKNKMKTAQETLDAAQSEVSLLQQSCKHKWKYSYHTVPVRGDSYHEWHVHVLCDKCEDEKTLYFGAPPCRVHLQEMEIDEYLENLPIQRGHRNRPFYKIQYKCRAKGCTETSVAQLWGDRG